ncbi:DEAD/DEAH box helicase family protein [Cohnella faecalis]|uniref:hypothetical protein n=1 Tax=Cohnella faecalis TaxID=2315694 RepID=UPI001F33B373|nr:hypothetical protein [Cohnella faecalis]
MNDWSLAELYGLIVRSDSYFDLPRERLEELLQVLSGFYPFARPLLEWDREDGTVRRKGGASAMAAIVGAGTIPQSGGYPVHHLDSRVHLGELDEEFIQESRVGDVFQLGTSSWIIRDIRKDRVYVSEAANRFSEVPFWRNESGSRSYELGARIGAFLREMTDRLASGHSVTEDNTRSVEEEIMSFLAERYGMDADSADLLIGTIRSQSQASELPTDRRIVIETYKDLTNQTHVIVLNHFGRRVNRAWQLAIERQFEQLLPYRMYGNAKDDGIEFVLPEWDASWLRTISQVTPSNVESLLTEAIAGSPFLAVAFRRIAETALLLSRSFTRTPLWQQRLRSEELLRDAMPYAERFPYLREAMKVCLYEYLDCDRLKRVLENIRDGEIEVVVRETGHPSPFASKFLADYVNMRIYEGDGIDETLKLQLMSVSKELAQQLFGADSARSAVPSTIVDEESRRLAEPDRALERAEDLVPLLKGRGDMTAAEISKLAGAGALEWLELMHERGRLTPLDIAGDGELRWICADERELYEHFPSSADSVSFIVGRYADNRLSFTEPELCERYPVLTLAEATRIANELISQDRLQRSPHAADDQERIWTSSKVASRLIRLSVGQARRQTEPVDPVRWCGHIALLQHALQGSQQQGYDGLRTVIAALQGLFAPLSQWETILFPSVYPPIAKRIWTCCAVPEK